MRFMPFLVLLLWMLPLHAQTTPAQTPAPQSHIERFDVTTVKRNTSGGGGSHMNSDNGALHATNITVKGFMRYAAFSLPQFRMLGGPDWLESERFDISAKMDAATAARYESLAPRDRSKLDSAFCTQLLADRFALAFHWETRSLPVYALVKTHDGSKLQPAKGNDRNTSTHGTSKGTQLSAHGITLEDLAGTLSQAAAGDLGRVVLDRTGLSGKYDVTLTWSSTEDTEANNPSIFTSVQEQLGLKLESSKGPVQVLVIDHLEMPRED